MRLLLDENLPKRLKLNFSEHEIFTVSDKKWNSFTNGKLLEVMLAEGFDALFTFDKNLQHQQNFITYPITVFILHASLNSYEQIYPLIPAIKKILNQHPLPKGPITISL